MAQLTVTAAGRNSIPSRQYTGCNAVRRALAVQLISGDAYFGWNSDVDASGASTAGIPMVVGSPIFFTSEVCIFSGPLYFYSATGAVISYQELNQA